MGQDEPKNPYAPPAAADQAPPFVTSQGASRGLRVSGGVVLLLVGLWSAAGGSCTMTAGQALGEYTEEIVRALPEETRQTVRQLAATAPMLLLSGGAIFSSGILCLIAGILFFFNRGRVFGLLAAGLGGFGELLYLALVALNVAAAVKIACLGFAAFCATRVGEEERRGPPKT